MRCANLFIMELKPIATMRVATAATNAKRYDERIIQHYIHKHRRSHVERHIALFVMRENKITNKRSRRRRAPLP